MGMWQGVFVCTLLAVHATFAVLAQPAVRDIAERTKRSCVNVWDDDCSNSGVPGSGADDDYFGSAGTPGKRAFYNPGVNDIVRSKLNREAIRFAFNGLRAKLPNTRSCVNVWDDDCTNNDVPGTGEDYDNFGNGSPGKRSGATAHPCAYRFRHHACRLFLLQQFHP